MPHVTPANHDFRHTAGADGRPYNERVRGERWLNWAAYATWLVVATPTIAEVVAGEFRGWRAVAWTVACAAFGVALWVSLRRDTALRECPRGFAGAALGAQAAAGLTMIALSRDPTVAATLVIVAAEAAAAFSPAVTWAWVAAQSGALGPRADRHA